jgi:hypothetical protein
MKSILKNEFDRLHKRRGNQPKLTVGNKLTITIKHLTEYQTMESSEVDYCVSKNTVYEIMLWVNNTLSSDKTFKLPGKRIFKNYEHTIQHLMVDMTESPIQQSRKQKK